MLKRRNLRKLRTSFCMRKTFVEENILLKINFVLIFSRKKVWKGQMLCFTALGICSLSVNPWSGVLSSPNYPHPYLSNQNCSWRFPDRGDGYRTMFTIKHLDLDGKSDCQKNLLTISSSTVNMVICSKSPTSLSLDSSSVEVKFQSKENSNKSTGFEIEYVVEG